MTEIADLAPCNYFPVSEPHNLVAVGWLSASSTYTSGAISDEFLEHLAVLIQRPWQPPFVTAGIHLCELCHQGVVSKSVFRDRVLPSTSATNIWVPHNGRIYVAPEAVGHYVACHRYRPPEEFIEAVLACPPVESMAFKKQLLACGGRALLDSSAAQQGVEPDVE